MDLLYLKMKKVASELCSHGKIMGLSSATKLSNSPCVLRALALCSGLSQTSIHKKSKRCDLQPQMQAKFSLVFFTHGTGLAQRLQSQEFSSDCRLSLRGGLMKLWGGGVSHPLSCFCFPPLLPYLYLEMRIGFRI